jgi:hypothetical protein
MKRLLTILLPLALLFGCQDVDNLLTFTISHETSFTVENSAPLNIPIPLTTPDITTNSSQEFDNHNTRADLVKDVKLEQVKLTITDPSSKTFSFLKSIHVYISTDSNNEIDLAYLENISGTSNTIDLETTDQKLDTYIKASTYKLRTSVVTKEALTEDIDIKMNIKFKVTADPLK